MSEPIRDAFLEAVRSVLTSALSGPADWGDAYPTGSVERRYRTMVNLGDRWHVCILDDDGSQTPIPDGQDGSVDDRCNFLILVQVQGDDVDPPSRWGHRMVRAVKTALTTARTDALWLYTKQRIQFESETVIQSTDGRLAEYQIPCTALLPENLGPYA